MFSILSNVIYQMSDLDSIARTTMLINSAALTYLNNKTSMFIALGRLHLLLLLTARTKAWRATPRAPLRAGAFPSPAIPS